LGHVALEVLDLLAHLVSYRTGWLEPSIAFLMQKLRRSKSAIYDALHALKAHGFLDWLRRYEPTGREDRGPQLRQTSNAYRLALPAQALRCLGRLLQAPPLPEDVQHARELQANERAAHRASLPLVEGRTTGWGSSSLASGAPSRNVSPASRQNPRLRRMLRSKRTRAVS